MRATDDIRTEIEAVTLELQMLDDALELRLTAHARAASVAGQRYSADRATLAVRLRELRTELVETVKHEFANRPPVKKGQTTDGSRIS